MFTLTYASCRMADEVLCGVLPLESNYILLRVQSGGTAGLKRSRGGPQKGRNWGQRVALLWLLSLGPVMRSRCPRFCSLSSPWAQNSGVTQQWDPCTTFFQRARVVSDGWCPLATDRSRSRSSLEEVFPYWGVHDSHRWRSSHELTHEDNKTHEKTSHWEWGSADTTHSRYWNCEVENTAQLCIKYLKT